MSSVANSVKGKTVLYFMLGLFLPLWPITLPLFWYKAYKSYKEGYEQDKLSVYELQKAVELNKAGVISDGELDRIKKSTAGLNRM